MISEETFHRLKQQVIKKSRQTKEIYYLINNTNKGVWQIVNSKNTVLGPGAIIDFIGFPFSDIEKLKKDGILK